MNKVPFILLVLILAILPLSACQMGDGIQNIDPETSLGNTSMGNTSDYFLNKDEVLDKGPVWGGTLCIFSTPPDSFNPLITQTKHVSDFLSFVYEGLVTLDEAQNPVPVLSDGWSVSEDGLVWTFHIRENVRWQDGVKLTADDVSFTMDYLLGKGNSSAYSGLLSNVAAYAAIDSENFKLVLKKPNAFTAETMIFPILPEHKSKEILEKAWDLSFKPLGTGPFVFDSYKENEKIILKQNINWWRLAGREQDADSTGKNGKPDNTAQDSGRDNSKQGMYIDAIEVKIYKDSNEALIAFQAGEIDLIPVDSGKTGSYAGRSDIIYKKYSSRNYEIISFNVVKGIFTDVYARRAIKAAINTNSLISDVYGGNAVKASLPIMPESWVLDGTEDSIGSTDAYEEAEPAAILEEGGWKSSERGYYKTIEGRRRYLEFEIIVNNSNKLRIAACTSIIQQLEKHGIKASIKKVAWKDMLASVNSGKYDMALIGVQVPLVPDISFLYSGDYLNLRISSSGDAARNISGYNNVKVNNNFEMLYKEKSRKRVKEIYSEIFKEINDDCPYVGLYFIDNAVLYKKTLRGDISPHAFNLYDGISNWYINKGL